MSDERPLLFSGSTLQRAVLAAARHFGLEADEVAYRLREHGGAVRGQSKVLIEVDATSPRRLALTPPVKPPVAPPAVVKSATPVPPVPKVITRSVPAVATGSDAEAVQQAVVELLRLAGLQVGARVVQGEGALELELDGPDQAALVESEAELLSALAHLTPRVARGLGAQSVLIRLDSGGFRARHEADLRALAQRRGEQARRTGSPVTLEEMSPADRRIVHLTLAAEPDLETESQGDGFYKRITVHPKKRRHD